MRILLVEDNPGDAKLIRWMLADEPHEWREAARLSDALAQGDVDVVLLDLSLPDSQGLDTFRRVAQIHSELPILVLTGLDDRETAMAAVRLGAQDYLVKGQLDEGNLKRAISYAIERQRLLVRVRELDALKGLFLSVVSHDLKSPAGAIVQAVDLLLSGGVGELQPKQRYALGLARKSAERQIRLIADLQDVSAMESGGLALKPAAHELGGCAQGLMEELRPLADARGVALRLDAEQPVVVWVDPGRCAQIFSNLVGNAIKFARSMVHIRVLSEGGEGRLVVTDDGSGLSPDIVEKVFERYVRGTDSRSGSGLGLWIVRGLVEAHGGRVTAKNGDNGGAVFEVRLPLAEMRHP